MKTSSTCLQFVNVIQILMLLNMMRMDAIKTYGSYILLDNEQPDLLHELKPYGIFRMCQINTTADHNFSYINRYCYRNNFNKTGSLRYAWYDSRAYHADFPKCTPLHSGIDWSWTCERNLPPSEVTPYRNCSVVCKQGYSAMNHLTARCSVNSQNELEWFWFGNRTEPYCRRIPVIGVLTSSVIYKTIGTSTTTTSTTTTSTATSTTTTSTATSTTTADTDSFNAVGPEIIIGGCIGGGLVVFSVVITIIIIVKKRRQRNSNSSRSQIYSLVAPSSQEGSSPPVAHGCCYINSGDKTGSAGSSETSFSSSSKASSQNCSNDKINAVGEKGKQIQIAESVDSVKISTVSEIGDRIQLDKPVTNEFLLQREVDNDSERSEDSDHTRHEDTINFDGDISVQQPLLDIQENMISHSIPFFRSLSLTSLNQDNTCITTPLSSGLIGKRPDDNGHLNDVTVLPTQRDQKKDIIVVDSPTVQDYTKVGLQTVPTMNSSIFSSEQSEKNRNNVEIKQIKDKDLLTVQDYTKVSLQTARTMNSTIFSSEQSDKNRNNVEIKQMKDKDMDITTLCQTSVQNEVLEGVMCILLINDIRDMVFLQTLGYYLDPDNNKAKSWYGLTLTVLNLPKEKVKTIRHHTLGNVDNGHFMATIEHYIAQGKYLSDIVEYFTQEDTVRPDVIKFIKRYHSNCARCNLLYTKVNQTNVPQNQVREASVQHHSNSTMDL